MSTVGKSVRVQDDVMNLVEEYISFEERVFGIKVNFSELVNDALCVAIHERVRSLANKMEEGEIVVVNGGKRIRMKFTEEEIAAAKALEENALFADIERS